MNSDASISIPTLKIREVDRHGVHLTKLSMLKNEDGADVPHRDEHYLFILQKKGRSGLMLDFKKVEIKGTAVFFILPGQIHYTRHTDNDARVLVVDPSLINDTYKSILDQFLLDHDPVRITLRKAKKIEDCIAILADGLKDPDASPCEPHIKRGLVDVIAGLVTREYPPPVEEKDKKVLRRITITRKFKALLFRDYKHIKRPSDYAKELNISTPYLNEAVKLTSGFTVSYWIQKMIIVEAKRLLYYTDHPVKKIAYELGYDDHAYFSRIFTRAEKISPQSYRRKYR
jgi:AraC-like DNA-binding protein